MGWGVSQIRPPVPEGRALGGAGEDGVGLPCPGPCPQRLWTWCPVGWTGRGVHTSCVEMGSQHAPGSGEAGSPGRKADQVVLESCHAARPEERRVPGLIPPPPRGVTQTPSLLGSFQPQTGGTAADNMQKQVKKKPRLVAATVLPLTGVLRRPRPRPPSRPAVSPAEPGRPRSHAALEAGALGQPFSQGHRAGPSLRWQGDRPQLRPCRCPGAWPKGRDGERDNLPWKSSFHWKIS